MENPSYEYPAPSSYTAIELMGHGLKTEELQGLSEKVLALSIACRVKDRSFTDNSFQLLANNPDLFMHMNTASFLADPRSGYCPYAVTLNAFFDPLVKKIMAQTGDNGINAYVGRASEARFRAYLCRSSAWLAGRWDDPWSRDMAMAHAAKIVYAEVHRAAMAWEEKWLQNTESRKRLFAEMAREAADFPMVLRKAISAASQRQKETVEKLFESYNRIAICFCKGEDGYETWDNVVSETLSLIGTESSAGYVAKGVREKGYDVFLEDAEKAVDALSDRDFPRKRRVAIASRIASGKGHEYDVEWLQHVDRKNPFSYNIPSRDQAKLKMRGLAAKVMIQNLDIPKMENEIREMVENSDLLRNLGAGRGDVNLSVYCMLGRGIAARNRYGEEEDAWEAFEKLREMTCEKEISAPGLQ